MVLSYFLPEKKSPIEGIPVIPGGTLWGGHLHLLQEPNFQEALHKWTVQHADSNGRCTFWMGPTTPSLSVTQCDDVQLLLKASAHRNVFPLMETHFQQLFGKHNVGLANGTEWKQQRSRITKALHSHGVVQHHEQAFQRTTQKLVEQLLVKTQTDDNNESWQCDDILPLLKSLTMDCFGQAAFHADFGTCEHFLSDDKEAQTTTSAAIGPAFDALTCEMMRRVTKDVLIPTSHIYSLPTAANQQYAKEKETVLSFLEGIVRQRQDAILQNKNDNSNDNTNAIPKDLLSGFLEHFQNVDDNDNKTDNKELALIIAQSILGLLFAGYETSSVTMCYTLYLLSQHPQVLAKCLEELAAVQGNSNNDNNTTAASSSSTTIETPYVYLEAVLKETLRLYPPAISTTRSAERDLELPSQPGQTVSKDNGNGAIVVPKGTYLYFAIWTIQRDPKHYPNPNEFQPERWVCRRDDTATGTSWQPRTDVNTKAWVPFSAGARSCPGQRFAMQEMIAILSCLLPALSFEPPKDYVLEPHRDGFVQVPKGGIPMTIRKRDSLSSS